MLRMQLLIQMSLPGTTTKYVPLTHRQCHVYYNIAVELLCLQRTQNALSCYTILLIALSCYIAHITSIHAITIAQQSDLKSIAVYFIVCFFCFRDQVLSRHMWLWRSYSDLCSKSSDGEDDKLVTRSKMCNYIKSLVESQFFLFIQCNCLTYSFLIFNTYVILSYPQYFFIKPCLTALIPRTTNVHYYVTNSNVNAQTQVDCCAYMTTKKKTTFQMNKEKGKSGNSITCLNILTQMYNCSQRTKRMESNCTERKIRGWQYYEDGEGHHCINGV